MNLAKTLIFTAVCCSLASCANDSKPVNIKHAQGELTINKIPTKTIVLDIATLDNLNVLGVPVAGVPTGNLVGYLDKYEAPNYIKAGTLFEPDLEIIKEAKPDLIIVGARSASKYEQVAAIAPSLDLTIEVENYIDNALKRITELGQIFNKQDQATVLNFNLSNKLAKLKNTNSIVGKTVVLMVNNSKISSISLASRMGWLYRDGGFSPIDGLDTFDKNNPMPLSYLSEQNPEWIFVIERDSAIGQGKAETAADKILANSAEIRQTSAYKTGQIIYLHPQEFYIVGNGYTALTNIIDQIQSALSAKLQ